MCEWLSCAQWCDVELSCGGRTFSAHRAVLASVSSFLRKLFLSCPLDETPSFIVLPDFDIESLSLVLFYIYHGEVTVNKQKLNTFLDIVDAMEIYIDYTSLPEHHYKCKSHKDFDDGRNNSSDVFSLSTTKCFNQRLINVKRKLIHNYSIETSLRNDNKTKYCEQEKIIFNETKKSEIVRNTFTEGNSSNCNGRIEGVIEMSSEQYHEPSLPLDSLENANVKHPSSNDGNISLGAIKTPKHIFIPKAAYPQTQMLNNFRPISLSQNTYVTENVKFLMDNLNRNFIGISPYLNYATNQDTSRLYCDVLDLTRNQKLTHSDPREITIPRIEHTPFVNHFQKKEEKYTRTTILNYVTESPWCSHTPKSFKPFRKKEDETQPNLNITMEKSEKINNDDNNNVQEENYPKLLSSEIKLRENKTLSSYSIADIISKDEFKCCVCGQVFPAKESLISHERRHNTNARYSCTECDKTFSQLRNYKYHMSVHRGTKEFAATCAVCGKYFNDRGYLSSHMKIHRNRKEYKCSICPKSFNQRVAYNMHVRIHTGVKPHVCDQCGKAFSRKMLLKQHQRTHSGERPYSCTHCEKRFADRSNMTLHLRLHTGVKPFSCTLCSKSFTKKHHLKSHLNFHTGAKPYSCPRCDLAFTQSSNMRTHYKKCTVSKTNENNSNDGSNQ